MRIKINDNAARNYVHRCYRHAHASAYGLHRQDFMNMLSAIEGKWIEVETKFLFRDQFNTVPIPGVSELGMRIMQTEVVKIQNDIRRYWQRCGYCGKNVSIDYNVCNHCHRAGYLEPLGKG